MQNKNPIFIILYLLVFILNLSFYTSSYSAIMPKLKSNDHFTIFLDVTIVDVESGKLKPNSWVLIKDNKIINIGSKNNLVIPKKSKIINTKGKYLIPGLWDMHVHILDSQKIAFPSFIANGVVGVRDMSASFEQIEMWKEEASKSIYTPRIFYSGPALDNKIKSHFNIKTEEEARKAVRLFQEKGVDFIKPYTWLEKNIYYALVDECKIRKIPFAGHVPFEMSPMEASNLGQSSIEHFAEFFVAASKLADEVWNNIAKTNNIEELFYLDLKAANSIDYDKENNIINAFAKNKTWQTPTLSVQRGYFATSTDERSKYIPKNIKKFWEDTIAERKSSERLQKMSSEVFDKFLILTNKMNKAKVPFLAGTDANISTLEALPNVFYGFSIHDEMELFVKAGLNPIEALQTATINPAKFLGIDKDYGSIEIGKTADLVLLTENPLIHIENTKKIDSVMINGILFNKNDIEKTLKQLQDQ
ncbi:amidohydrolase family protein [Silvanigrella paludirubra]|uniref:Amidohydrolase family protein n=1 Tax=Silvanigrella paludirubra TaxID=2499159 RepID=A0A6N6VU75_9BACT|nr:amidohydrolase family protein [Silvanigrella paludirubra]KAB8037731.1 amidohydrolase family protein [Silvanigrella paludirubra]